MAISKVRNLVKSHREARGWSQAELAQRTGISRAEVSAIETHRLLPSVATALSLARALGCRTEDLFCGEENKQAQWAWTPASLVVPTRYWVAQVRNQIYRYPVESTAVGLVPHDGTTNHSGESTHEETTASRTLIVASCDPAAGLLISEYARVSGYRMIVLPRSSKQALELLRQGVVHAAGVHFSTTEEPARNRTFVGEVLKAPVSLIRMANWQEGISFHPSRKANSACELLSARLRWVGREAGSAAYECQRQLLHDRPPPRRTARDHRGIAEAIRCGWADVGVCHRLVSEEAGLEFLPIREELFDLCIPQEQFTDPRILALVRVIRDFSYRKTLCEIPGITSHDTGEMEAIP